MIILPIDLELILPHGHVRLMEDCELIYEPGDPYAVALICRDDTHGSEAEWTFSRDLLTNGIARQDQPIAPGDVKVWRCSPHQVHITLESPEGVAMLHADAEDIEKFLTLSYGLVPLDHEMRHVDIDRELAAIFGGTA